MAKKPDTPCAGCGKLLWKSKTSAEQPTCRECRRSAREQAPAAEAMEMRACAGCAQEFTPRRVNQRRCRRGCGKSNGRKQQSCEVCGQEYRPTCAGQRACSRTCGIELRRSVTATVNNTGLYGRPREAWPSCKVWYKTCLCGRPFTGRSSRATYCSECQARGTSHCIQLRYRNDPEFRDYVISRAQMRRAEKLGVGSLLVTLAYLMERDGSRCGICHQQVREERGPDGPSIDHVIPLSRGGRHELSNVQLAHLICNRRKHNSLPPDQAPSAA